MLPDWELVDHPALLITQTHQSYKQSKPIYIDSHLFYKTNFRLVIENIQNMQRLTSKHIRPLAPSYECFIHWEVAVKK